jgi:two-component system, sensor histidine kinase and response regulator
MVIMNQNYSVLSDRSEIQSNKQHAVLPGNNDLSELRLREFIDFLPQIFFESDEKGKITKASRHAMETFGYKETDIEAGIHLTEMLVPELRTSAMENLEFIKSGIESKGREYELLKKDGSRFNGIIYTSPVIEYGKFIGFRGIVIDISEKKAIESALVKSESRFRTLFENSYEAILFVEHDRIIDCNNRALQLFNYTKADLLNLTPEKLSPVFQPDGSYSEVILQNFSFDAFRGNHQFFEWQFRKKDGSLFFSEVSMSMIETGGEILLQLVIRDITERKKHENKLKRLNDELEKKVAERTIELKAILDRVSNANIEHQILIDELSKESQKLTKVNKKLAVSEQQLREALDTKDKFFSIIAHDIKNPLYSIILNSEILVNYGDELDQERLLQKHNQIYMTTKRLNDLLENLLQWARSQMGKINYEPSEFDLNKMVHEIADLFKPHLESKNLALENNIPRHSILYADIKLINTVIRNLVSNAVKYSNKDSKIEVNIIENNDNTEIFVKDHGVGISPEKAEKIFKIGKTISTPGTDKEKGTGLGLILCKEFVELHGGRIWIESNLNQGSEFHFTIPFKRRL